MDESLSEEELSELEVLTEAAAPAPWVAVIEGPGIGGSSFIRLDGVDDQFPPDMSHPVRHRNRSERRYRVHRGRQELHASPTGRTPTRARPLKAPPIGCTFPKGDRRHGAQASALNLWKRRPVPDECDGPHNDADHDPANPHGDDEPDDVAEGASTDAGTLDQSDSDRNDC